MKTGTSGSPPETMMSSYLLGETNYFRIFGESLHWQFSKHLQRYRIGPFEVESVLLEHPSVAESAVVASPDDLRGQIVKAFIVPTSQYSDKVKQEPDRDKLITELQDFVKGRTAPYKYPRSIEFVDSLPKTVSGKIMRNVLRKKETSQHRG